MRGALNDALRHIVGAALLALGAVLRVVLSLRLHVFDWAQRRLRARYRIGSETPLRGYDRDTSASIEDFARSAGSSVRFARTSGSTNEPKRLAFTKARMRRTQGVFIDVFSRAYLRYGIRRAPMFVFGPLQDDDSLTSLMLGEEGEYPPYLSGLQAPYRLLHHPAARRLGETYGATALRFWAMVFSNPGVLYATNPSTLVAFLEDLKQDWAGSTALIRDFVREPAGFPAEIRRIARRLVSIGAERRLRRIAGSPSPLPFDRCVPGVEAYACWTGGYVGPFLERLDRLLSVRRIPMYSMSTETVETVGVFGAGEPAFLPIGPGVLYEFLEEGSARPLPPRELRPGTTYEMVVSDAFGLRRYRTDDLFQCVRRVRGLPDLRFLRRRGLEYSFTGEKLTAQQVATAFGTLREEFPSLDRGGYLSLVPSRPETEIRPHYRLTYIRENGAAPAVDGDRVAARFEEMLRETNEEYRSKVDSRRLDPARFYVVSLRDFATRMANVRDAEGWEAQFKFLPLYRRLWETGWTNVS